LLQLLHSIPIEAPASPDQLVTALASANGAFCELRDVLHVIALCRDLEARNVDHRTHLVLAFMLLLLDNIPFKDLPIPHDAVAANTLASCATLGRRGREQGSSRPSSH